MTFDIPRGLQNGPQMHSPKSTLLVERSIGQMMIDFFSHFTLLKQKCELLTANLSMHQTGGQKRAYNNSQDIVVLRFITAGTYRIPLKIHSNNLVLTGKITANFKVNDKRCSLIL